VRLSDGGGQTAKAHMSQTALQSMEPVTRAPNRSELAEQTDQRAVSGFPSARE
jgi:hypothetical protein